MRVWTIGHGTRSADELVATLREAGVDMSTPAPVEATLALFARRVDELEALLQP